MEKFTSFAKDVRRIFRQEMLPPGDFVLQDSLTSWGIFLNLLVTDFTIPLVSAGIDPMGKLMTCALTQTKLYVLEIMPVL